MREDTPARIECNRIGGLLLDVFRRAAPFVGYGRNPETSHRVSQLTLVGVINHEDRQHKRPKVQRVAADARMGLPTPDRPAYILQRWTDALSLVPATWDEDAQAYRITPGQWCASGNFATGDSRLREAMHTLDRQFYGAVAIHDHEFFGNYSND